MPPCPGQSLGPNSCWVICKGNVRRGIIMTPTPPCAPWRKGGIKNGIFAFIQKATDGKKKINLLNSTFDSLMGAIICMCVHVRTHTQRMLALDKD